MRGMFHPAVIIIALALLQSVAARLAVVAICVLVAVAAVAAVWWLFVTYPVVIGVAGIAIIGWIGIKIVIKNLREALDLKRQPRQRPSERLPRPRTDPMALDAHGLSDGPQRLSML